MTGGIAVLFGPTGGYLIGFLLQTWITGWMIERTDAHYLYAIFANLMGSLAALICGTIWLKISGDLTLQLHLPVDYCRFTAGSNQGNWSSLYRYLDEKRLNRFLHTN